MVFNLVIGGFWDGADGKWFLTGGLLEWFLTGGSGMVSS